MIKESILYYLFNCAVTFGDGASFAVLTPFKKSEQACLPHRKDELQTLAM